MYINDSSHFLVLTKMDTYMKRFQRMASVLLLWPRVPLLFTLFDSFISLYFRFACGLHPVTVDLDDDAATTLHFWAPTHRRRDRPNLLMVHGYGGDARWQFFHQAAGLSRFFNLYVPDLVFFGHSFSSAPDRTDAFQARCIDAGLRHLGVERFSIYAISYGGYVAYRLAEVCRSPRLEKAVIVSSGVGFRDGQKEELIRLLGRDPRGVLLPETPKDLRFLVSLSFCRSRPLRWLPDFFLQDFINEMVKKHRKEKLELLEHLLVNKPENDLPVLSQEILLVWGDQDRVFPPYLGYQLERHLGPNAKLEILKDTGHAANMESPDALNDLIKSFVLGHSQDVNTK